MGTGIWSMHFIGMLAFNLPVPMAYDVGITFLSMLIAIVASGFALYLVRKPYLPRQAILTGGLLMGIGISTMHYTGMAAMKMAPPIAYDPLLFIASVLIAIGASSTALWIAYKLRKQNFFTAVFSKFASALIMGIAIAGMHYTGMAAAEFVPGSISLATDATGGMRHTTLAVIIGIITVGILMITLAISALDSQFAAENSRLADALQVTNEQLRHMALYDRLTGLPNRMLLDDRMTQAATLSQRNGKIFAVLFVDLDNFKPVNDTYGHAIGDKLLKSVGQRLLACVRKSDTISRLGGDEFIVILNEIDSREDVATVCDKMLSSLSRPFVIEKVEIDITASIGISLYPKNGTDLNILKESADVAMYKAKQKGRNQYAFFIPEPSTPSR